MLGPSPNLLITSKKEVKNKFEKNQKNWKKWARPQLSDCRLQLSGGCWSPGSLGCPTTGWQPLVTRRPRHGSLFLYSSLPLFAPHFFPHVVNSSSLAPAHAHPAHISPKIFKHP
jgi:hypothetical protein